MEAPLKKTYSHFTNIQIRFNDVDILGHVNNSIYQNFYDIARLNYFMNVFTDKPDWKFKSIVLAQVTIQYFIPIGMHEEIKVYTKIHEIGNKSLHMKQLLVNENTGEIKSENNAILVAFNSITNETFPILEGWKTDIQNFEKEEVKIRG